MPETPITVVIPVGPLPVHQKWLNDAVESVIDQQYTAAEILLIDDMAGVAPLPALHFGREKALPPVRIWRAPWHIGVPAAFNFGVALAKTELVFMLGSDDLMDPRCLGMCAATYERMVEEQGQRDADNSFYYVGVSYIDNVKQEQFLPTNEAMVSKTLWKATGGFPIETSVGMPDSVFMSMMWNRDDVMHRVGVGEGTTLVKFRYHPESDTETRRALWHPLAAQVVNIMTEHWAPPQWGRYAP